MSWYWTSSCYQPRLSSSTEADNIEQSKFSRCLITKVHTRNQLRWLPIICARNDLRHWKKYFVCREQQAMRILDSLIIRASHLDAKNQFSRDSRHMAKRMQICLPCSTCPPLLAEESEMRKAFRWWRKVSLLIRIELCDLCCTRCFHINSPLCALFDQMLAASEEKYFELETENEIHFEATNPI